MTYNCGGTTYNRGDTIACPYCGHILRGFSDYEMDDGDVTEVLCDGCDGTFSLSLRITVCYTAEVLP